MGMVQWGSAEAPEEFEDAPGGPDSLSIASTAIWNDDTMAQFLAPDVHERFKDCLLRGEETSQEDKEAIAEGIFKWARSQGAISFAHWFFPMRGGGGAVGGAVGAYKADTLIDLDWKSKSANKPFLACLPADRLFQGETDGSSFPNGGLRVTHTAAAFTSWDRSSPPFIMDDILRIPCCLVTHYGKCIDEKTPLLRSMDALQVEGLRLLQAIGIETNARKMYSYLGWEQEFFVVPAELYKKRPDLVNCGRTLIGSLPSRNQQGDLNYFAPIPIRVKHLLDHVEKEMLKMGCPMAVKHNEVAPGQHEMSPIFGVSNLSADSNVLFMEVCNKEACKLGLQVLFHEKPFAGINGNGKHANWSVGTDTGLNFFYPGKSDDARKLYVTGVACLAYGLLQYNELVRCAVAHAGNDHRLGAQEAPPAIISLYPGTGFEAHVDSIINGGDLLGYNAEKHMQNLGCTSAMAVEANVEDRNRTAPFPFCGNRFEFRAVGSSQNCSFPIMICNTIMAAGMAHLAGLIEGGMTHRDAVAQMFKENRQVIFTGNGYSAEWPIEAKKRGLSNLKTTPEAVATFASDKNKALFDAMKVYAADEVEARAEVMYENYITSLTIEAQTLIKMIETGILPACAKDLAKYAKMPKLVGERKELYSRILDECQQLKALLAASHAEGLAAEAIYLCDKIKPKMGAIRELVDKAEGLLGHELYPYPSYEALLFEHHH